MTYSPWRHLAQLPAVLVSTEHLEHADAYWEPDEQVILLDRRLGQAGRRSRLAHELAHVEAADECCTGPDADRLNARQEARAEQTAACRLVTLDALADALAWAWHTGEIAEHLHVDEDIVVARVLALRADEKQFIERRLAGKGDAA